MVHVITGGLDSSQAARMEAPLRAAMAIWMPWRIEQAIAGKRWHGSVGAWFGGSMVQWWHGSVVVSRTW